MNQNRAKSSAVAVVAGLLLSACSQAATEPSAAEGPASADAVGFTAQPDLAVNVQALPRLAGDSAAIVAINADLERLDAAARAGGCEGGRGEHERSVTQPMTGPGYITFAIAESLFCEGTARPSIGVTPLTYDVSTGQRVDWVAVAPGLSLTQPDAQGLPAGYVPGLQSAALAAWYGQKMLATPNSEWVDQCRSMFETESLADDYFRLWADAERGGVAVSADFPHVAMACAETAVMTPAEMQQFGVTPALIEALAAAKAAGNWAPKDTVASTAPAA